MSWHPSCPLRRIQNSAVRLHLIPWIPSSTDLMAVYCNSKRVAVLVPSGMHMDMRANSIYCLLTTLVTTAWICMECSRRSAVSIILDKVELRTTASTTRVAVVANRTWKRDIEIVVDAAMGPRKIHVELNKSSCQIEGRFRTRAPPTVNSP